MYGSNHMDYYTALRIQQSHCLCWFFFRLRMALMCTYNYSHWWINGPVAARAVVCLCAVSRATVSFRFDLSGGQLHKQVLDWRRKLTHYGWDKMLASFQPTFSNSYYCMKLYLIKILLKSWCVPNGSQQSSTGSDNGLSPIRCQAIIWTNDGLVYLCMYDLTHWGRVTHICVSDLTIIASDNGLSPGRRQAIIWTNAGILLLEALVTNFSENLIEILTFSINKVHLKMSSAKWRLFRLGLNMLNDIPVERHNA